MMLGSSEMVEVSKTLLDDLITRYGITLVTRWVEAGAAAYEKRKQKPKRVSDRSLNQTLRALDSESLKSLISKLKEPN